MRTKLENDQSCEAIKGLFFHFPEFLDWALLRPSVKSYSKYLVLLQFYPDIINTKYSFRYFQVRLYGSDPKKDSLIHIKTKVCFDQNYEKCLVGNNDSNKKLRVHVENNYAERIGLDLARIRTKCVQNPRSTFHHSMNASFVANIQTFESYPVIKLLGTNFSFWKVVKCAIMAFHLTMKRSCCCCRRGVPFLFVVALLQFVLVDVGVGPVSPLRKKMGPF